MVSMHNPLWDHKHRSSTSNGSPLVVPIVVILAGLAVLMLGAVVVVRIYRYRKRAPSVSYIQLFEERT